jgi:alpha-glucoside transport system substrate-binding protein
MLRTQPPEVYDGWVTNEIPFDDPRIVGAIETFGWFARNDAYVAGGAGPSPRPISATAQGASSRSRRNATCTARRRFIPAFFPEGTEVGEDADFFYFPAFAEKDLGQPVLGAGTLWAITKDSPGRHAAFMEVPANADRA